MRRSKLVCKNCDRDDGTRAKATYVVFMIRENATGLLCDDCAHSWNTDGGVDPIYKIGVRVPHSKTVRR